MYLILKHWLNSKHVTERMGACHFVIGLYFYTLSTYAKVILSSSSERGGDIGMQTQVKWVTVSKTPLKSTVKKM